MALARQPEISLRRQMDLGALAEMGNASLYSDSTKLETGTEKNQKKISPEGGFSEGEAALAAASGACLIGLGPRILRAETVGLAAGAAILYEMGDM